VARAHARNRSLTQQQNRRARHDYLIEDTLEAGLVLFGTEVKMLRTGPGQHWRSPMPTSKAANFFLVKRQHPRIPGLGAFQPPTTAGPR